jgi:tetratricopeptide (TPR) repeat protein
LNRIYDDPAEEYFALIEKAFKDVRIRWEYFKDKVSNKPISVSNILLAQILKSKKISSIVITPNFDDFLSRALSLMDIPHVTIDNPQVMDRFKLERDEIQIIHTHGTYKFYDICNTQNEIEDRAGTKKLSESLKEIFVNRSPIVIGYSGWKSDSIMTVLDSFLDSRRYLENNIYWFCYEKEEALKTLPEKLKEHPNVVFVVADKHEPTVEKEFGELRLYNKPITKLSSDEVLNEFIKVIKIELPVPFKYPIEYYERFLKNSLYIANHEGKSFYFDSVLNKVKFGIECVNAFKNDFDNRIEQLVASIKRSRYKQTIKIALDLSDHFLDKEQMDKFSSILRKISSSIPSNYRKKKEIGSIIENIFTNLFNRNPYLSEIPHEEIEAKIIKIKFLLKLGFDHDVSRTFIEIAVNHGNSIDKKVQNQLKRLFNIICLSAGYLKNKEKLRIYETVIQYYDYSTNPILHVCVVKAYYLKGLIEMELNRSKEAQSSFDRVIELYKSSTFEYPKFQEWIGRAIIEKGKILRKKNKLKKAHDLFKELENRFEGTINPNLKKLINTTKEERQIPTPIEDKIYSNIEVLLSTEPLPEEKMIKVKNILRKIIRGLGFGENELAILGRVIKKYGNMGKKIDEFVALVLVKGGEMRSNLERGLDGGLNELYPYDEMEAYNEIINRFWNSDEPKLIKFVIDALEKKAEVQTDNIRSNNNYELAQIYYNLAQKYEQLGMVSKADKYIKDAWDLEY